MGILLSVVIFAGCTKDKKTYVQSPVNDVIYTSNSIAYPVTINYKLTIQTASAMSLIQWNNGYVNADYFVFIAARKNGNNMTQVSYGTKTTKRINLGETQVLGNVYVPRLVCDHAAFDIGLDTMKAGYSLLLNGSYTTMSGTMPPMGKVPVQVIINAPVDLNTIWINNVTTYTANYWDAAIEFSTDQLINGITPDMLDYATLTSGAIIISSTSNPTLYQIIINNLQNNVMPVLFASQNIVTSNPSAE
jgi:hypothetical protein